MKILYLITGLGGGGAEKVVADLADQMLLRGHHVKIVYLKGEAIVKPQAPNIELICLELNKVTQFSKAFKKFKTVIKQFKPDVVHAHMVHANIFARLARKYVSFPRLICTAHSNNEGGRLRMLAYRLTHALADMTTNVSRQACESFESFGAIPKGDILTVYNGIDLRKFNYSEQVRIQTRKLLKIEDHTLMFLAVGRFHEAKNYPLLINAFAEFVQINSHDKEVIPAKLYIAGDGELRFVVEELIAKYRLEEKIILLGRRDDVPALMCGSDYFVLSSAYEGFGLVVAEAMACNNFVIATDCGGVSEVMGGTGLLVNSQEKDELVSAFFTASQLSVEEIAQNNIRAMKYINEKFNLDNIVNQWLSIYAK
ncbi:glycosyltransferase [Acinetobacter baumannii]|uniref:glycosyltransferase n=1 Tax=Acinetobacter calcoaceticus/baumannii complex TaxID=909768 RepID=UPI00034CB06E|nr:MULTISPECIES: glycosyltransferase [Acinetobacter calcoaceticus/baumannii complex]MDC4757592.1 glycosyltransferase [Acinetobacter baumannii]MDC5608059.1 glycosyltransferase [Acinetobacter baumannii]MDX9629811.1 glycosyltransferase [Acinetobacter baumannii]RSO33700.1 glycosyltransferase [Acinetobacter lactucae]